VTKQAVPLKNMRLTLTLSLLHDNTYIHYDTKMEDVGNIIWQKEFSADLGQPLAIYYEKDNAYFRKFENGTVVSSPDSDVKVNFEHQMIDTTTGNKATSFTVKAGDGRIFLKP